MKSTSDLIQDTAMRYATMEHKAREFDHLMSLIKYAARKNPLDHSVVVEISVNDMMLGTTFEEILKIMEDRDERNQQNNSAL